MIKKEELFVLIKSLSRSEKRYIRLLSKQLGEHSSYIKVFDAIDTQDAYDEAILKQKFKNEVFVKQFHVIKNYLRNFILKSLRNFHAQNSKDAELKDSLRNVEILFNKELYQHCLVELKRAEQIARDFELFTGLIEVQNWKRRLKQTQTPHDYDSFLAVLDEQKVTIGQLSNKYHYNRLIVDVSKAFGNSSESEVHNEVLLKDPENALSIEARIMHYNAAYFRSIQRGNVEQPQKDLYELIQYLEQFPKRLKEDAGLYISTVNNFVSFFIFNKQYESAMKFINKIKNLYETLQIKSENKTLLKQILRTYNLELEVYRAQNEKLGTQKTIDQTELFVSENLNKMPQEYLLSFSFQLANINFVKKDFKKALKWVNIILNNKFNGERTDIQVQARMLNLMIHLEQQNLFVLRYYVDSTKRFFKKVKQPEEYEQLLLRFFIKIGKAAPLDYNKFFKELYQALFPSNKDSIVPNSVLGYIDYRSWLQDKVNK